MRRFKKNSRYRRSEVIADRKRGKNIWLKGKLFEGSRT